MGRVRRKVVAVDNKDDIAKTDGDDLVLGVRSMEMKIRDLGHGWDLGVSKVRVIF